MTESKEQAEIIKHWRSKYPEHVLATRLSLNGLNLGSGKRAAIIINHAKSQGMVKGESDLFFSVPKGGYHGLYIEHKALDSGHQLTSEQADYLGYMMLLGYKAVSTRGVEEAIAVIDDYMG